MPTCLARSFPSCFRCFPVNAQVQKAKADQVQREVDRLQRSLAARDSLIQQLKTARLDDTPAREVRLLDPAQACASSACLRPIADAHVRCPAPHYIVVHRTMAGRRDEVLTSCCPPFSSAADANHGAGGLPGR